MNRIVIRFVSGNVVRLELEDNKLKRFIRDLRKNFGARLDMAKYGYAGNYIINTQTIESYSCVDEHEDPVMIYDTQNNVYG